MYFLKFTQEKKRNYTKIVSLLIFKFFISIIGQLSFQLSSTIGAVSHYNTKIRNQLNKL